MRTRTAPILVMGVLSAACSGASLGAVATPTPAPATPTAVASIAAPTPTPTPVPPTPTATPSGPLAVIGQEMLPYQHPHDIISQAQLVVDVQNTGSSWVHLLGRETTFTVHDANGNALNASGGFKYAFPAYLAPGETGRYTEVAVVDGNVEQYGSFEAALAYEEVDEADAVLLPTDSLTMGPGELDIGVVASGNVTNSSTSTVSAFGIAAFFFDSDGVLLGYAVADDDRELAPDETAAFTTPAAPTLLVDLDAIASMVVVAAPRD